MLKKSRGGFWAGELQICIRELRTRLNMLPIELYVSQSCLCPPSHDATSHRSTIDKDLR